MPMNNITSAYSQYLQNKANNFFSSPSPLYIGAIVFIVLQINFLMKIHPNDYWWYVQAGKEILQNNSIPVVDSYTYTQAGKPYPFIAWLSSVLFWLLRDPIVATLLHASLPLMYCGLIWQCCRSVGAGTKLTFILTVIVILVGSLNWSMRPQLFSLPLFAMAMLSLLHWQRDQANWVWMLPIIVLFWVNLHGAFPLLFLLAGAALVGGVGNRKALALAILACFFTSLCNPQGIYVWQYVFSMMSHPPQQLGPEWIPPTTALTWQVKLFFCLLLLFPLVTSLSSRRLNLTYWLWFLGFAWMALGGVRYIAWFVTVFAPINAILLAPLANRTIDKKATLGKPALNIVVFIVLLLAPLALLPQARSYWLPDKAPQGAYTPNTPVDAVDWLKLHSDLPGNLWADIAMSVYIIYALPERPVWTDTRTDLFPKEHWSDYFSIVNAEDNWGSLLARDNVKLLLLDPKQQPLLIKALKNSPHWQSPYADDLSIIFTFNPK